jgi:hypothetical protein
MLLPWEKTITGQPTRLGTFDHLKEIIIKKNENVDVLPLSPPVKQEEPDEAQNSFSTHRELVRPLMKQLRTIVASFANVSNIFRLSFGVYCDNNTHALYTGLYQDEDVGPYEKESQPAFCLRQVHLSLPTSGGGEVTREELLPIRLSSSITFLHQKYTSLGEQLLDDAQAHMTGGIPFETLATPRWDDPFHSASAVPPDEWQEIHLDLAWLPLDLHMEYYRVYVRAPLLETWLTQWQERFIAYFQPPYCILPDHSCELFYRSCDVPDIHSRLHHVETLYREPTRHRPHCDRY